MKRAVVIAVTHLAWFSPLTPPESDGVMWVVVDKEIQDAVFDPEQTGWIISGGGCRDGEFVPRGRVTAWTDPAQIIFERAGAGPSPDRRGELDQLPRCLGEGGDR